MGHFLALLLLATPRHIIKRVYENRTLEEFWPKGNKQVREVGSYLHGEGGYLQRAVGAGCKKLVSNSLSDFWDNILGPTYVGGY